MRVLNNVRFGVRLLIRQPLFAASVICTLALGIGANSAIFSLFNAVVLRPLPVREPERLLRLQLQSKQGARTSLSYTEYLHLRDENEDVSTLVAHSQGRLVLTHRRSGDTAGISTEFASANYFDLFEAPVMIGRPFSKAEDLPGADPVLMLSHRIWVSHFDADPGIVGGQAIVNGLPFTIVGVCSKEFTGITRRAADVYVPIAAQSILKPSALSRPDFNWLQVFAVLNPEVVAERAQASLSVTVAGLAQGSEPVERVALVSPHPGGPGTVELILVNGSVGLILLIACANVSNLMLVRAYGRRREFAVRVSLGATRRHLISQCLAEGLILALLGALLGILVGYWMADSLVTATGVLGDLDVRPDSRVFAYALFLALVALFAFGSGPALRGTRFDVNQVLKEESSLSGFRAPFRRRLLVTCQVGASVSLLIVAGLLAKGFYTARFADRGFSAERVVQVALTFTDAASEQGKGDILRQELLQSLGSSATVEATGCALNPPYGNRPRIEELQSPQLRVGVNRISGEYFRAVGMRLIAGRNFTEQEIAAGNQVAIVSESLARRLWPTGDAVGRAFATSGEPFPSQVVGIVNDLISNEPRLYVYRPLRFRDAKDATILIRTTIDPQSLISSLSRELPTLDRAVLPEVQLLKRNFDDQMKGAHADTVFWGSVALLAIVLATVGMYGVVSSSTMQRTREIGVRMALGATSRTILRMLLLQGLPPVAIGLSAGLILAAVASRVLTARLHGLSPLDPSVYVGVCLLVGLVALTAAYLPARRAALTDPLQAVRYQ
jgi:putative ABC transport system permease protein